MSEDLSLRLAALALAVRDLLTEEETPTILRVRLRTFLSELRDSLSAPEARRVDGIEAEAVITSFGAETSPVLAGRQSERGQAPESRPERRQKRLALQRISAGIVLALPLLIS